ncbi:MAG TPA: 30S ribosomal protein S27e [Candidatus Nanoarchaeia archaeon]|nr:30S ribosomal protein S27e [Candidatus Nanoarchaeia archaeon]
MTSNFLKINCPRCGAEKIIFGKSTLKVKCPACKKMLVTTTGGKTRIKAPIRKVL